MGSRFSVASEAARAALDDLSDLLNEIEETPALTFAGIVAKATVAHDT